MKKLFPYLKLIIFLFIFTNCEPKTEKSEVDTRSYRLGVIGAFAEVIDIGIKKMALSSPATPEEMDALIEEAEKIAERNNTKVYRENDFLVTDLFPESVTKGKHVLVIYQGSTLDEYLDLKKQKNKYITEKNYTKENRLIIARKMAELLSYPEERIIKLLANDDVEIN